MHEKQLHHDNSFITLTYSDEHLPFGNTLVKKDFQKFAKRLLKYRQGESYRYFHCGEYGDTTQRPHYHAILFGVDFPDKQHFSTTNECHLFTSPILNKLWPYGHSTIGEVTFESAAYVARYVVKKITGIDADKHYQTIIPETGEIVKRQPEYATMSLKPAIGKGWYEKYHAETYPSDEVIMRGLPMKPPKYYDKLYELTEPEKYDIIKEKRKKQMDKKYDDNSPRRLRDKETVKKAQINNLKRKLDDIPNDGSI